MALSKKSVSFAREMEEITVESGETKAVMKATHLTTWNHLARENSGHLATKSTLSSSSRCLKALIWVVCHQNRD